MRRAELDLELLVRVRRRVPLRYLGGAEPRLNSPAHVRAASGLTWWRDRLAVVSDDASFIGLVNPADGRTEPITLPHAPGAQRQFDTGRGNKVDKLDLESACVIAGALVGFGSDSGLAVRRRAVVVDDQVRVIALPRLYAALRQPVLGNGQLNLEAAAVQGPTLWLGNRGGDLGADGQPTHDALVGLEVAAIAALLAAPDTAPLPPIAWEPWDLGDLDGAPLRLTELEPWDDHLLYAATAEATASAYDDGVVTGSALGVIAGDHARWAPVLDERGAPLIAKIEGLAARDGRIFAAVDADDPEQASELLELEVAGTALR